MSESVGKTGMQRLHVIDVTLRDGEQAPGFAFSLQTRIRLARLLDRAGVYQIEAGVPAAGTAEQDGIRAVKDACVSALVSTWNRANFGDIEAALACGVDVLHICMPVSRRQICGKLGITPDVALERYRKCAALAVAGGVSVTAGFEDASRADPGFMLHLAHQLKDLGVVRIRISDTVGVLTPASAENLVRLLGQADMDMEIHAHNDLGMAAANSYCAALGGAAFINVTLAGIGERAGNCSLLHVVRLVEHGGLFDCVPDAALAAATEHLAASMLRRDEKLISG
jgi:homocitrate synthase NifV